MKQTIKYFFAIASCFAVMCYVSSAMAATVRTIAENNTCQPAVSLSVTPGGTVKAYAVEETLPYGLTPSAISENGVWDSVNRTIKWGTFPDSSSRTLTYKLTGAESSFTISGNASFDGSPETITGDTQAVVTCTVAKPRFDPPDGTEVPVIVTISCETPNADIRYTTDGTPPDSGSSSYTAPLEFDSETTLKAKAFKTGMTESMTATATYPGLSPIIRTVMDSGTCSRVVSLEVTPDSAVKSYAVEEILPYGLNPSNPSDLSGGIWNPVSRTIRWGAFPDSSSRTLTYDVEGTEDTGYAISGMASFDGESRIITGDTQVTIDCVPEQVEPPIFDPPSGAEVPVTVTISSATYDADIRYTTDDSKPVSEWSFYSDSLYFDSATILKAIATRSGMTDSDTVEATYNEEVPTMVTRTITNNETCSPQVSLEVTPLDTVQSYAVEESVPYGLTPSGINENGVWNAGSHTIKWGAFTDNTSRTLTYNVEGESNTYTINGKGSFDGRSEIVSGDTQVIITGEYAISGYIRTPEGNGISGVDLTFSNAGGSAETESSGYYSYGVRCGWSGTVMPMKSGYTFNPSDQPYSNVTSDQPDQNYAGMLNLVPPTNLKALSGRDSITLTWEPSAGASLAGYNIYRSESSDGSYTKVNTEPVMGKTVYSDDSDLTSGTTYFYYLKTVDLSGNESGASNVASAVFGELKLFIPDARGDTGTQVRLPVNIANANGLNVCGADISVTYDPTVLEATDIEKTPLSAGYGWDKNITTPGVAKAVIATGANGEMLYGEGSLFHILFNVEGNEGDTTDLEFQVSGTFVYDCSDLQNSVSLDLSDIGTFMVNKSYILCDLNGDGRRNSADVAMLLRIAVGNMIPSEEQENAGDASGDGYIRSNDAAMCLRIAAGIPLVPGSSDLKRKALRASSVNVSLGNTTVSPGNTAWVPINISNTAGVMGADIVLNYDSSLITATNAQTTTTTEGFEMDLNTDNAGQIRISLTAKEGEGLTAATSGTLVGVQFIAKWGISGTSPLTLASVRLNDTYSRDFARSALQVDVQTTSGSLTVEGGGNELRNAVLALKVLAGMDVSGIDDADVNGDGKIEMEDVIRILQTAAGVR